MSQEALTEQASNYELKGSNTFSAIWMQLEITVLSTSERERQISHDITYMWNLKYDTNELIYITEIDSQTREQTYGCQGEGVGGGDGLGVWD